MLPREGRLPTEPERYKEALAQAISQWLAAEADRDEKVRRFRARVLADQPKHLLVPDKVEEWLDARARKEGEPSWWLAGMPIQPEQIEQQEDGTVLIRELRFRPVYNPGIALPGIPDSILDELHEQPNLSNRLLVCSVPHHGGALLRIYPVRAGGILNALRLFSDELAIWRGHLHRWRPQQAAMFILSGMVPLQDTAELWWRHQDGTRRTDADGELKIGGRRALEMSVKHLELAAFTAWHGETLAARMAMWNDRFPEWAYREVTNFGRDSREARRRLVERIRAYADGV
jgi:hypothetical protein